MMYRWFAEVIPALHLHRVCLGGCGLSAHAHRRGVIDGFGLIHWGDRHLTRRGLRRFLLLVAKRDREYDPAEADAVPIRGFLNDARQFGWLYPYLDNRKADAWAAELDTRFPIAYSKTDRLRSFLLMPPGTARKYPAVYSWARKGWR